MKLKPQAELSRDVIFSFLNRNVTAVYRVLYVVKGEINWDDGFLQLHFSDDRWLLLRGHSDGETLLAKSEAWVDPFAGDLDAETQAWVKAHGRFELIDMSTLDEYRLIVGKQLTQAKFNVYYHAMAGVQLVFEDVFLSFVY